MTTDYDVVVIGGGHNGLVTAAYLARKGRSVLLVEGRDQLGGAATTLEAFPGFWMDTGASHIGLLHRRIVRELGLKLEIIESPIALVSLTKDNPLRLWNDASKSAGEITRFSSADSARYVDFHSWIRQQSTIQIGRAHV